MSAEHEDRRWWLLDPEGHRALAKEEAPKDGEMIEFMGQQVPVIVTSVPDGVWCCDWCNADIPVKTEEGHPVPVPMLNSSALCLSCFRKVLTDDGKIEDVGPISWSTMGCSCPPCKAAAVDAVTLFVSFDEVLYAR